MAQMELKGVKGFGKAIRFTTEDCEKVKREYNSLLAELAIVTPEHEHGVLFTFPVTMYNEGEASIKEGNLRDGYSKIYGAYIVMTFIKSLRSQ